MSNLNRLVHRLEPVLAKYLNPQPPTPLKRRIWNWEEFQQAYPELTEVVINGTEQVTQRPRSSKATTTILLEQTETPYDYDSNCRHQKRTSNLGECFSSCWACSWLFPPKRSQVMEGLPKQVVKRVDLGYQGIETDYQEHVVVIPQKKPVKQALTPAQKRSNCKKAKQRIVVEHTLAHMKQFQVLSQTYRNRRGKNNQNYNRKLKIVAGLVNLRYESRIA